MPRVSQKPGGDITGCTADRDTRNSCSRGYTAAPAQRRSSNQRRLTYDTADGVDRRRGAIRHRWHRSWTIFTLCVEAGYVSAGYGQNAPTDEPRPLVVEDSKLGGVDFRLVRASVIVANITDEFGEPVAGAIVNVFRASSAAASRKLTYVRANGFMAFTDDRGEVRLFNLAAGSYYVSARRPPVSSMSAYRKTSEVFYPGTLSAVEAKPVHVDVGQEVPVNFSLIDVRLARVTGSIVTSTGAPYPEAKLQFLSMTISGIATQPISISGDAQFVAVDVPPGTYLIQVRPGSETGEYANQELQVIGDDISGIVVATSPPATVTGQIIFEQHDRRPKRGSSSLRLRPKFIGYTVAPGRVSLANDWTFEIANILGKGHLVVEDPTNTWFLDGVYIEGRDVTDEPLDFKALNGKSIELRITAIPTVITGTVVDAKGVPIPNYNVVAFSEDPKRWYEGSRHIATTCPDQYGRFTLRGLPAGAYYVAAIDRIEKGDEFSLDFLEQVRVASTHLSIDQGDSKFLRLSLSTSPR